MDNPKNLQELLPILKEYLESPDLLQANPGFWPPGKVFEHCAQSIRYSRTGFPEMKSAFFRNTAGKLAFQIFSAKNAMNHGLTEPIPGAEPITDDVDTRTGLLSLIDEIETFLNYTQELKPHFAFGSLSHEQYSRVHTWHIMNHKQQLRLIM